MSRSKAEGNKKGGLLAHPQHNPASTINLAAFSGKSRAITLTIQNNAVQQSG
jgi:hypothetical protein